MEPSHQEIVVTDTDLEPTVVKAAGSIAVLESLDLSNMQEGVPYKSLGKVLGVSYQTIARLAEGFRDDHPEWLQESPTSRGVFRSINPDGAKLIIEDISQREPAPADWITNKSLSVELETGRRKIENIANEFREEHPEWFGVFKDRTRKLSEHYSPELVQTIREVLESISHAPEDWQTNYALAKRLGISEQTARKIADEFREEHPEWFEIFNVGKINRAHEHYHPDAISIIEQRISDIGFAPEGWETRNNLRLNLGAAPQTIQRSADDLKEEHPEWFRIYKDKANKLVEHYSPEAVLFIEKKLLEIGVSPEGWKSKTAISKDLRSSVSVIEKIADEFREEHPEWFGVYRGKVGKKTERYHPEIIKIIEAKLSAIEAAPESWMTKTTMGQVLDINRHTLEGILGGLRDVYPQWTGPYRSNMGHVRIYYAPELIELARERVNSIAGPKVERAERKLLQQNAEDFLANISNTENNKAGEFQQMIQLFGAERAVDLLFQYRPDYQKLPIPYLKNILAEYLGDYLMLPGELNLESLETGANYLSNPSLKDSLSTVIRNSCLRFYNEQKQAGRLDADLSILLEYIEYLREQTSDYESTDIAAILDENEAYFRSLFNIQLPDSVIEQFSSDRSFPDLNQRINIHEIMLKQRILIADEMGVGKSASAILAKESLGLRQALVIVPSNVVEVWRTYLSDRIGENGGPLGYFKSGEAPRVLIVESLDDLLSADPTAFDYIVISQERLTDEYLEGLELFDYDMLVVDEVHKLKNISYGARADNLIKLASRVENSDKTKYLALLSGTPVPNKVSDIAMVLRLLYPEKFGTTDPRELVGQIITGDILDLRSLLVPRMQMKFLSESIEMPALLKEMHVFDISDYEKMVYEMLLEEDELTAAQKMSVLRQFVLNPTLFDPTPEMESTKVREVGEALRKTFANKDKVVMFVNNYIEGVIRGEKTIFDSLELPEGVELHVIDGYVSKKRRLKIQELLKQPGRRMLLAVSGQTADVGVDFSSAEEVYHYNEPWTKYEKMQQIGREYRPGLKHDLVSHTFIAGGTIEEGIHRYVRVKYQAIEKLLRGIPVSELEQELLKRTEHRADPEVEVTPELAKFYISSWDRMLKIFGHVKEIGEPGFVNFLGRYAEEYANCYVDLGTRSYQANVNRLAGTLIDRFAKDKGQPSEYVRILDVASGPEMLKRHIAGEYQNQVVSVDINPHHFEETGPKQIVGSYLNIPIADSTVDYVNLSLALHYTRFVPSQGDFERVQAIKELNRVLTTGGRAIINMMHNLELKYEDDFRQSVSKMGFKVVEEHTGVVESGQSFRSGLLVLEKVFDCATELKELTKSFNEAEIKGFKFRRTGVRLRNSRRILSLFNLGSKQIEAKLNDADQRILDEEQAVLAQVDDLKRQYGSIKAIPNNVVIQNSFARVFNGRSYVLFKKLEYGPGAVIAK